MKKCLMAIILTAALWSNGDAQTKKTAARLPAKPGAIPAATARVVPTGSVLGHTYSNRGLGFEITFPDIWLVAGDDFVAYMKSKGVDITPKPPKASNPASQKKIDADFRRLKILLTVYRSLPGTQKNAVARIAAEDISRLNTNRPVKDAVDYVDLMRSQMNLVKMPAGFSYSETQAEKLGPNQFAYLDSSQGEVKTRVYVTVRKHFAILFSLEYAADEDLEIFRDLLARAKFSNK